MGGEWKDVWEGSGRGVTREGREGGGEKRDENRGERGR